MAKAYWIVLYHSVSNPQALAEYGKLAVPAVEAAGGRILARGMAAQAHEAGLKERSVVVEFDNLQKAIAAYETPAYKAALKALAGSAKRDMRIVEGL